MDVAKDYNHRHTNASVTASLSVIHFNSWTLMPVTPACHNTCIGWAQYLRHVHQETVSYHVHCSVICGFIFSFTHLKGKVKKALKSSCVGVGVSFWHTVALKWVSGVHTVRAICPHLISTLNSKKHVMTSKATDRLIWVNWRCLFMYLLAYI